MASSLRIVCMGERGACAHGAGRFMFPDADVAPQPSYQHTLEALIEGAADYALLPAYNTRTGSFPDPLVLLARSELHVVAEVWREIRLQVMVPKRWVLGQRPDFDTIDEAKRAQVRAGLLASLNEIVSDQAGFSQYDSLLKRLAPRAQRRVLGCTGEAARIVHQGDRGAEKPEKIPNIAALASSEAARMYGLVPLTGEGVSPGARAEDDDNATLFYVVARKLRFNPPNEKRAWYGFSVLVGQERLRRAFKPGELALLFQDEDLAKRLKARVDAIGLDAGLYDAELERERANVLFEALSGIGGAQLRQLGRLARKVGGSEDMVRRADRAEQAAVALVRERDEWKSGDEDGSASAVLRRSKDVKSVLFLRAKKTDPDGQSLMHALFEGETAEVRARLMAVLPSRPDGSQGPAFVIETDGYLAGLDTKKKQNGFSSRGTPPERLLTKILKQADAVQVMGSMPRAAQPGLVEEAAPQENKKTNGWRWRVAAAATLMLACGGAVYWAYV